MFILRALKAIPRLPVRARIIALGIIPVIGFLAIGAAYMVPTPTSATRTLANTLAVEAEGLQSGIRSSLPCRPHSGARGTKPISQSLLARRGSPNIMIGGNLPTARLFGQHHQERAR
jgi:hypothetical protein